MENEFLLCPRRTNGGDGNAGAPHRRAHGRGAIIVALGVALTFGRPTAVSAAEFLLRVGDLQVPAGTVVHGAAIAVGGTAYVDGTVEGDAIALGGNVDVSGHVTGSVRADGGSVILHSTATVDGEAAAFGGTVVREPGAAVGGRRSEPAPPEPGFPMRDLWGLGALAVGLMVLLKPLLWLVYFFFLAGLVGSAWMIAVLFPRAIARGKSTAIIHAEPTSPARKKKYTSHNSGFSNTMRPTASAPSPHRSRIGNPGSGGAGSERRPPTAAPGSRTTVPPNAAASPSTVAVEWRITLPPSARTDPVTWPLTSTFPPSAIASPSTLPSTHAAPPPP